MKKVVLLAGVVLLASCATLKPGEPLVMDTRGPALNPLPDWAWEGALYEISIGAFTPEGTFAAAIPKLEQVRDLGVKTLWLAPFSPLGVEKAKGDGSLFCQKDKRGVDPVFGTLEQLLAFRDRAHELGMKVIIDISLFQTSWDHPWVSAHPDWYRRNADGTLRIFSNVYSDIVELRQDHPQVRQEMLELMKYWIVDLGFDGFRLDSAPATRAEFWKWALPQVYAHKPLMLLGEGGAEELSGVGLNAFYGYGRDLSLYWASDDAETLFKGIAEDLAGSGNAVFLRDMSNHDYIARNSPDQVYGDPEGVMAAAVVNFTLPGIPMVFAGNEVGSDTTNSVVFRWKTDWTEKPGRRDFYKKLLALRNSAEVLKHGTLETWYDRRYPGVAAYRRLLDGKAMGVIVNITAQPQKFEIPPDWGIPAGLRNLWTGEVLGGGPSLVLEPYGWLILGAVE